MRLIASWTTAFALCATLALPLAQAAETAAPVGPDLQEIVFSEAEKRLIKEFFGEEAAKPAKDGDEEEEKKVKKDKKAKKGKGKKGLPPGLAKRDALPPGLAKRELPPGLSDKLPPSAPGTERTVVEDDIVLIEKATGKVLDILVDVVKNN